MKWIRKDNKEWPLEIGKWGQNSFLLVTTNCEWFLSAVTSRKWYDMGHICPDAKLNPRLSHSLDLFWYDFINSYYYSFLTFLWSCIHLSVLPISYSQMTLLNTLFPFSFSLNYLCIFPWLIFGHHNHPKPPFIHLQTASDAVVK